MQILTNRGVEDELCRMQAEFCKGMSHPKRIQILNILKQGERSVTELVEMTGIPQANLSQHLSVLRQFGLLETKRSGSKISYSLADARIGEACNLVRKAIEERLRKTRMFAEVVK
ncbi:MAG: metalloregulator ArsR/SmtB family transcription factor [Thaumarchaeota archaeon]|nr:metalloregulator ArsR/SmtB family transcription factor [Nitrososphaerota archaeon]